MRKSFILIFISMVFGIELLSYGCGGCDATQSRRNAWQSLSKKYITINNHLTDIKNEYKATLIHFQNSNERLESEIRLLKENLLIEKEILFLLKQFNELKSVENSVITTGE